MASGYVTTPRRYALLKYYAHMARGEYGLAGFWHWKHDVYAVTPLPGTFFLLARLTAALYSGVEDLLGADLNELQANAGLSRREAQAVLTAVAAL